MAIDARIPLQTQGVNVTPIADALAGRVARERQEGDATAATQTGPNGQPTQDANEALSRLAVSNPFAAKMTQNIMLSRNQQAQRQYVQQLEVAAKDALKLRGMDYQTRQREIMRRIAETEPGSPDFEEYSQFLNKPEEDQLLDLQDDIQATMTAKEIMEMQQKAEGRQGDRFSKSEPVITDNGDGTFAFQFPVTDKTTGDSQLRTVPFEGAPVNRQTGETAQARQQRDIDTAGGKTKAQEEAEIAAIPEKEAAKGSAQFHDNNITQAIESADGLAIVKRSLTLLDGIKTGGTDAASLYVKQQLGVESADEAELTQNLAKAVLSQLRDTFGAQFTENEGKRLERIEAGIGKSTAGNRRILNQLETMIRRKAERGIESAIETKRFGEAQQIQEALDFELRAENRAPEFSREQLLEEKSRRGR